MEPMEHTATASASIPISINDWIESCCYLSSTSRFVESAVDLAWMITKHTCDIIESSVEFKLEDQITAENVIIFVLHTSSALQDNGSAPTITDVKFRFEVAEMVSFPPRSGAPSSDPGRRAISVALGKLFFRIFSRGKSSCSSSDIARKGSSNFPLNNQLDAAALPPTVKRRASEPISSLARNLLISLGMPLSICQLVCDLLDTENESSSNSAQLEVILDVTSVAEALWDLLQMKTSPEKFLFDRTCSQKALDDTCLFDNAETHLVGREREISALMTAKENISCHVRMKGITNDSVSCQGSKFLCEAAFLSGYAGSGKSGLLQSLIRVCSEEQWFVLGCKFDKQAAPHMILAKAFNDFFGKWGPKTLMHSVLQSTSTKAFHQVCRHIFAALDDEGFQQLCDLAPNFALMFPVHATISIKNEDRITSMDKVGSAQKRLRHMFHVLLKSLCSVGHPVLFTLDDLQWAESFVVDSMADFVVNYIHNMSGVSGETTPSQGLLIAGAFRSNEMNQSNDLVGRINFMKQSGKANVTMMTVGELAEVDVTKLISLKLCLPWRYTQELAKVVHRKTRGNPFFAIQFLRSIIQNKMLSFSVKSRRWMWDCDVVDMQMISDGVAELLMTTFVHLSPTLMQAVEIASCLGAQVDNSTINELDSNKVLPFNMQNELPLAVKEGIMEKAGPLYQFTHDIIQQTIYELIPPEKRKLLHKTIGTFLLKSAADNPTTYILAVDQFNIFCKSGGNPTVKECLIFSKSNATAAKFAISSSSFEQARSYINMGIQLLETQHWRKQYTLSLDLFEMAASISCMHGDVAMMSSYLDEILSHAKAFSDTLKASSLRVKLLASLSKFEEARSNCVVILSRLGEVVPSNVSLPLALNCLSMIQLTLKNITSSKIKLLPQMTDRTKLNAMKFLNMLCMYSNLSNTMLLPYLSSRMVKLTMEYGFCDDSIVGLATAGFSIFHFTDDIQLASHIGKVSESLIEESPKKHILRSRLCSELVTTLKAMTEPFQSVHQLFPELYNSAMLSGDVENAMISRWHYCAAPVWIGVLDLFSVSKQLVMVIKEAAKYQQNIVSHMAMITLNFCSNLSGGEYSEVDVKSFYELDMVEERIKISYLSYQSFAYQLAVKFWMREYEGVVALSEKRSAKQSSSQQKRFLNTFLTLYQGIAYLTLARDTKEAQWKILGEEAVAWMSQFESMSKWNFENKSKLLQAELHYLDEDLESAESAYKASIKSAHDHRLFHEEALACELYGIFCVENQMVGKGRNQLRLALNKYKQWGAMKKANELQLFIDLVDPTYLRKLKLM